MAAILKLAVYPFETLLAQAIILFCFPKKRHFVLSYFLIVIGYLVYDTAFNFYSLPLLPNLFLKFVMMFFNLLIIAPFFCLCFEGPFIAIVSACTGGVAIQHIGYHINILLTQIPALSASNISSIVELASCLSLYAFLIFFLPKLIKRIKYYENCNPLTLTISIIIVLICVGITRLTREGRSSSIYIIVSTSLYAITSCSLALFIQFGMHYLVELKSENFILNHIREQEKKQYDISKGDVELLNIKCHDLKHLLKSSGNVLSDSEKRNLENIIYDYDSQFKTGNEILDVILSEKNYQFRTRKIDFTFLGDGTLLDFLTKAETYSLVGNLLNNCLEAVEKLDDQEKKIVSMCLSNKGSLVFIDTVNYYQGSVAFENGLPQTSKKVELGYHGIGMKSIEYTAREFHGGVNCKAENGIFRVNVYLVKPVNI